MTISLKNATEENELIRYLAARDAPRQTMAHGVYPNAKKALAEYDALLALLGSDMSKFVDYHDELTKEVKLYVGMLQDALTTIVATMEGIEQAAPGTFGIPMPQTRETTFDPFIKEGL